MTTRDMPSDTDEAVELLASPPTNDDLDELLDAAAPHRRSKLTIALIFAIVFVVGFLAGSVSEKVAVSVREAEANDADATATTPAGADSGPLLIGHVAMIADGAVYVERLDGPTVKVYVSDGTAIGLTEPGEASDLVPGDAVVVHGRVSPDGTIDASSIQQSRPSP